QIIVHDEGGVLLKDQSFLDILSNTSKPIAISEHTVSGTEIQKNVWNNLKVPYISMARSWLKTDCESFFIAEASFQMAQDTIKDCLKKAPDSKLHIGVIGCGGNIGSVFIKYLIRYFLQDDNIRNCHLHISDINTHSAKYGQILQIIEQSNLQCTIHAADTVALLTQSDLVFSCTGTDVMPESICTKLTRHPQEHTLILCNLASGTREFATLLSLHDGTSLLANSSHYHYHLGKISVTIQNRGRPIIFNGRDNAVHPLKIDMIRAGTLVTLVQSLIDLGNHHRLNADVTSAIITLDVFLQNIIYKAFKYVQYVLKNKKLSQFCVDELFLDLDNIYLNKIIEHSAGALLKQIDVKTPSKANRIGNYDPNHQLHLLASEDGEFYFCIVKHGKKISGSMFEKILNYSVFNSFLNKKGLSLFSARDFDEAHLIDKFYFAHQLYHCIILFHEDLESDESSIVESYDNNHSLHFRLENHMVIYQLTKWGKIIFSDHRAKDFAEKLFSRAKQTLEQGLQTMKTRLEQKVSRTQNISHGPIQVSSISMHNSCSAVTVPVIQNNSLQVSAISVFRHSQPIAMDCKAYFAKREEGLSREYDPAHTLYFRLNNGIIEYTLKNPHANHSKIAKEARNFLGKYCEKYNQSEEALLREVRGELEKAYQNPQPTVVNCHR
ncbi:MAG TPA: hypothetical protein VHD33_01085, partial [Legionellaceae bacterium]|nr:hypothetical protein [Legionellaceae bacterium]